MKKFKTRYTVLLLEILIFAMIMTLFDLNELIINFKQLREQPKFILYECSGQVLCGGLVDRFKGIMNAYAWSLFTKRLLIIKISKPCDFNNLIEPNRVNWNSDLDQLVNYGLLKANYTFHKINKIDNFNYKSVLKNIDIINYQNKTDVISIFTNLEWISAYSQNMYLNKTIEELGFKHNKFHFSTAFNKWFNHLFKLNALVQEKFDIYLNKLKPDSATKLICIQVRIGGARLNVDYDLNITPRKFSKFYWDFVKEFFIKQKIKKEEKYKIFVTADMESVEREAIEVFGFDKVFTIDGVSAHVDRENGYKNNCTRFEKIVIDFYILGNCDMALVSDSGFGIFGILRNRIPDDNFYVLTALSSGLKRHKFFLIKDFIYANPHRY